MFLCQSHLNDFVNYMNILHKLHYIQNLRKMNLSFLDVKITPRNNQLVTQVFRMATFGGVFTNLKLLCLPHTSLG